MHAHNQPDLGRWATNTASKPLDAVFCSCSMMRANGPNGHEGAKHCQPALKVSLPEQDNNYFHQLASNCNFFTSPCFFSPPASVATIHFTHADFHHACASIVSCRLKWMRAAISLPFLALGPLILSMQSLFIVSMIVKHGAAIFDSAGVDRTEVEDLYHRIRK